jgi:mannosyltransferase OCH1-like enzyme
MKIPKIFHRIWLGPDEIPLDFKYYGETFKKLHPDWEYRLWTDNNLPIENFINKKLFKEIEGYVLKVDMARFEILRLFGGVYADTDFEFYKNIENLIENLDIFSAGEKKGIIGNAIFGSMPNHPLLTKILKAMPKSIIANEKYGPNIKTGPVFLTWLLGNDNLPVFGPELFFPAPAGYQTPAGKPEMFPDAYANHHWAASWVGLEEKVTGHVPKDIEHLLR